MKDSVAGRDVTAHIFEYVLVNRSGRDTLLTKLSK